MSPSRLFEKLRGGICRFARGNSGMAATEFAIIAPIMMVFYFGLVEYTIGYEAKRKSTSVASIAADLIAQEKEVCDPEMADAFLVVDAVMHPFPLNSMQVRITSVIEDGAGGHKVAWSDGHNMSPRAVDSTVTLPRPGLVAPGGSVIMSEIAYTYNSPYRYFISAPMNMPDASYYHPRKAQQIDRTAMCSAS